MLDFQRYQLDFTAHIRNPKRNPKPAGVIDSRMAIYREVVFNNLYSSVSACFPVCQIVLGKRAWKKLVQDFMSNYQANSPIFREIPQQFLQFLAVIETLPDYFKQLAHYEWVELAVSMQAIEPVDVSQMMDLLNEKPVLSPANQILAYDYPVHQIGQRFKPKAIASTNLLVFRNALNQVKFIELNAVTYRLLQLINQNKLTGKEVLTKLAVELQHPDLDTVIQFGLQILTDLANQQAIIGSVKSQ